MHATRAIACVALTFALALVPACNSSGHKRADKTGSQMDSLRATTQTLREKVTAAGDSLLTVVDQAEVDPKTPFDKFKKDVSAVRSARQRVESDMRAMKASGAVYFVEWESQSAMITDPELKQRAEERRTRLTKAIEDIDTAMKAADSEIVPYMTSLADMQTYFANDLTPAGIQAARGTAQRLGKDASSIGEKLDRAIAELEKGAPEFKTSKPPPAPKSAPQ